ncbi:MAG: hypothetical protein Q8S73_28995 [Deltaproteobacteria bacterium]|nr:hypothetical protein [Myxococcales bacterium]MDP3218178.1 hypothetical protein [Deltaproteobacteria bacterium]
MISRVSLGLSVFVWLSAVDALPRSAATIEPMPEIAGRLRRWTRARIERCRRGDALGCQAAAYAFRVGGDGVEQDTVTAARLYTRAWTLRPRRTEQDLLPLYEMGVSTPEERAYALGVCERGGGYACATVGIADLRGARSRRAQRAALDLIERGAHCPQVGYFHYSTEFGRDLREEYPWYFRERRLTGRR